MATVDAQVAHIWRRIGFGATRADIVAGVNAGPAALINDLCTRPATTSAAWAFPTLTANWDWDAAGTWIDHETALMAFGANPLEERLTWFLQNVLVISTRAVEYPLMTEHILALRSGATGSYKALLRRITTLAGMLIYLNGDQSAVGEPNANYARELCELFALGPFHPVSGARNYSETDIVELSRALTGWTVDWPVRTVNFEPDRWDPDPKALFGRNVAGAGVDAVIDAVAAHPAFRLYLPKRMYQYFVGLDPTPTVLAELSAAFGANGDLRALATAIVQRPEFLSDAAIGAKVKTPVECVAALVKVLDLRDPSWLGLMWQLDRLDHHPFQAPNVSGWPKDDKWLHAGTLMYWNDLLMGVLHWRDDGTSNTPVNEQIPALRTFVASTTKATVVDDAVRFLGLASISDTTRTALTTFVNARTRFDWTQAVSVLQLLLTSPEWFAN